TARVAAVAIRAVEQRTHRIPAARGAIRERGRARVRDANVSARTGRVRRTCARAHGPGPVAKKAVARRHGGCPNGADRASAWGTVAPVAGAIAGRVAAVPIGAV